MTFVCFSTWYPFDAPGKNCEKLISFNPEPYQSTRNSKTAQSGCEFDGSPSSAFIPTIT